MSLRVVELFGYSPLDPAPAAMALRENFQCPFVGGKCIKTFRSSGLVSGACAVKQTTTDVVVCCPNRMYAGNYSILADVAADAFGEGTRLCRSREDATGDGRDVLVFGKKWGRELRLPTKSKTGSYYVDWVLALLSPDLGLKEFVAVEVQTVDTTGSYQDQVISFREGKKYIVPVLSKGERRKRGPGINWENVNKRILPQIIYKSHVISREPLCEKGLYFVCPSPVYQRVRQRLGESLDQPYPKSRNTITFRWYGLPAEIPSGQIRPLSFEGQFTTSGERVATAFTGPRDLPESGVYQQAITNFLTGVSRKKRR
jgi:hypothetical protein